MNSDDFNKVVMDLMDSTQNTLVKKAAEYATDDDRLHNFKIAAAMQQSTPMKALGGMMAKHTTSIYDMIGSGLVYPPEVWAEKIGDHINYLVLLTAIIEEERKVRAELAVSLDVEEHVSPTKQPIIYFPPVRTTGTAPRYGHPKPHVDEIVLQTREDAENVLEELNKLVVQFKSASVYELYELVGITGSFADQKWGWTSFMGASVDRVRDGYLLNLPDAKPLDVAKPIENPDYTEFLPEEVSKAIDDQSALNDIAGHLARLSAKNRPFRKTDLNEIYNIVERVRVVEPEAESEGRDKADLNAMKEVYDILGRTSYSTSAVRRDIQKIITDNPYVEAGPMLDMIAQFLRTNKAKAAAPVKEIMNAVKKVRNIDAGS